MNKRQKKKYRNKCYYKRYDNPNLNPKTMYDMIRLGYRDPYNKFAQMIKKLIYSGNPIFKTNYENTVWGSPVILGLEHGITFSIDKDLK